MKATFIEGFKDTLLFLLLKINSVKATDLKTKPPFSEILIISPLVHFIRSPPPLQLGRVFGTLGRVFGKLTQAFKRLGRMFR